MCIDDKPSEGDESRNACDADDAYPAACWKCTKVPHKTAPFAQRVTVRNTAVDVLKNLNRLVFVMLAHG